MDGEAFARGEEAWWGEGGEFRLLREINPLRADFLERAAGGLAGKTLADVGCGGGVFAEEAARRGARVTGVDISPQAVEAAKNHAQKSGAQARYVCQETRRFAEENTGRFGVAACLEVLEHTAAAEQAALVADVVALLAPGGVAVFSTINRGLKAWAVMVASAELLAGFLPRGLHDPALFIAPQTLAAHCKSAGLKVTAAAGLRYDFFGKRWRLSEHDLSVNYFLAARRED